MSIKTNKRIIRHRRVTAKIRGANNRPRLSVFRSNKHLFLQIIDDEKNVTLISLGDFDVKKKSPSRTSTEGKAKAKMTKTDIAHDLGKRVAEEAIKKNIKEVVFDRGGYAYHGRVKAVAEGAREGGLKF